MQPSLLHSCANNVFPFCILPKHNSIYPDNLPLSAGQKQSYPPSLCSCLLYTSNRYNKSQRFPFSYIYLHLIVKSHYIFQLCKFTDYIPVFSKFHVFFSEIFNFVNFLLNLRSPTALFCGLISSFMG